MWTKMTISIEELCSDLPEEFERVLKYCRGLRFEDRPEYSYIRKIFKDLRKKENLMDDDYYEWHA